MTYALSLRPRAPRALAAPVTAEPGALRGLLAR